jgi:lysophospholipase
MDRPGRPTLAYELFKPSTAIRGSVLVTTGFAEHMGRYQHVYRAWREAGLCVCGYDLRGQGDSEGKPGHVNRFEDFVEDAVALLDVLQGDGDWARGGAPFLYGHSLGGLISFHTALRAKPRFGGLLLSSPFFGLAIKPARWQVAMAKLLSGVIPTLTQPTGITGNMLTHDPERARMIDEDPKSIHGVSLRWFVETRNAQRIAFERASELQVPTFCVAAGDDHIADVQSTRMLFDKLRVEHELMVEEHRFHELHQEVDRSRVIQLMAERMLRWSAPAA